MRPIPAALRTKLLNRVKSDATASAPNIRLVATQTSVNTLLSEPIHEDVLPAYGDVTVRQTAEDKELALAYAVCLDNGIATIYKRQFPAGMDYKWELQWRFGAAEDVAIEYDGIWKLDAAHQWYYLETEEFPYIFTVESGDLYVQKWTDSSTRQLLATDVSNISACKGWRNSITPTLDHGLIIGYLRGGEVYYRSLCYVDEETLVWESERKVDGLGTGNSTLAVIRTNDFRIGFLTEKNGEIKLLLTHRNYAGMSVQPETVHVNSTADMWMSDIDRKYGYLDESMSVGTAQTFFNCHEPDAEDIQIIRSEKLNRETDWYCYGVKVYFDRPLTGRVTSRFISECSVTLQIGTAAISSVSYDASDYSMTVLFSRDILRSVAMTVKLPETRYLTYIRVREQTWYLPAQTVSFEAEIREHYGYIRDTMTVSSEATFWIDEAVFWQTYMNETASVASSGTMELVPVSPRPI